MVPGHTARLGALLRTAGVSWQMAGTGAIVSR